MAINKNHPFEDLDGIKCAVVETGISSERVQFLKSVLEFNNHTCVVTAAAEKKVAPPKPATDVPPLADPTSENIPPPVIEEKFTLGVTDVTFNSINAIYGRLLKTPNGRVVTMAYWQQKENVSHDEIPYFDRK